VLQAVGEGTLYDPITKQPRTLSIGDSTAPWLKEAYVREFHRQLGLGLAHAYGRDKLPSKFHRAKQITMAASWRLAQGGMQSRDDRELLLEMFDQVQEKKGGLPIEYLYDVELWKSLAPPPDVDLQPIANNMLKQIVHERHEQSLGSAARRLVRKFKDNYRVLAALHILSDPLQQLASQAICEVGHVLERHNIPFRKRIDV
jgi:hypothetical protein